METGKDFEILSTNPKPFFWKKVKRIILQNKKAALQEFLFGSQKISSATDAAITKEFQSLKEKMEILQNQVKFLKQKVNNLENQTKDSKDALRGQNKASESLKTIKQRNYTLSSKKAHILKMWLNTCGEVQEIFQSRRR